MRKFLPLGGTLNIYLEYFSAEHGHYINESSTPGLYCNIPEDQRSIATVTSNGIVEPISVGTVSVEIKYGSGAPIAYYTVVVVTQEQYAKLAPLENGENLSVQFI